MDFTQINKLCGRSSAITCLFWIQSYPESLDQDRALLFNFLSCLKLPSCVSPLHDKDINEIDVDTGEVEYKKAHFHFVVDAENQKAVKQWFDILAPIREYISIAPFDRSENIEQCVRVWKNENNVKNMRSLLRYFKHLDNPEKHQYIDKDFTTFGGFEVDKAFYSQTDTKHVLKQILIFVNKNDIYNFADFVDYTIETNNSEWFNVLSSHTISAFIIGYMKSMTFRNTGAQDKQVERYEAPQE